MDEHVHWPFVQGTVAEGLRTLAWEATDLGAPETWPATLRIAIQSMLENPEPAFLYWGPDLLCFCNDAYRPLLGNRYPSALGAPLAEVWPELMEDLRPAIDAIWRGEPRVFPEREYRIPNTDGNTDPRWFRGTWWPLRDEAGDVRGFCGTAIETTDRILEERARVDAAGALARNEDRQAFLLDVAAVLRGQPDAQSAIANAAEKLALRLDVAFAGYGEVDEAGFVRIQAEYHSGADAPRFAGRSFLLDGFGHGAADRLRAGRAVTVRDIEHDPGFTDAERDAVRAIGVQSYVAVPVVAEGRLESYLFAAHDAPRAWSAHEIALVSDVAERTHDAVERARSEAASRRSDTRYRALFEAIDEGFCIIEFRFDPPDGRADYRVLEANPAFYAQTGFPEDIRGRWLREAAPDLEEHWYEIYGRVALTGEPVRFERDSDLLGRSFDVYAFRIEEPEDLRIAVLFTDVTERKRHETRTDMLLREINHRSKNILGLVQAIARQTAAQDADSFVDRFGERVRAMAAAQDVLIRNAWGTVPLGDLVRSQLAHFSDLVDTRIEIEGPDITVTPDAAQTLAMALHELATNAAKYGALSNATGRVKVAWSGAEDGGFRLCWRESGGPPVAPVEHRGFGSRVTVDMVEAGTGGTVTLDLGRAGLSWSLDCPAENVLDEPPKTRASRAPPEEDGRQRVLVVEDEPLIAADLAETLSGAGYTVLGPAGDVARALALVAHAGCDAAVLDMNLGHETSERVAEALGDRGIPYLVVSGYSRTQLPPALRAAPLLGKPLRQDDLLARLRQTVDEGAAGAG